MTPHDHSSSVAAVAHLLSTLLQGQNEMKGISERLKLKSIRDLRTILLSEKFRTTLLQNISAFHSEKSSNLETISWGNIIRDLVDIIEYDCSSEFSSKNRKLSTQKEMAETLQAVVRVALEDMCGADSEWNMLDHVFNDFILNALRFAFTSLKDKHRENIHSSMWCLARDILGYATVLQHLGRKQLAKWYELSFESFNSTETADVASRRLQLTAARQIIVTLIQKGQLFQVADQNLLNRLMKVTLQFLQECYKSSVLDTDGISFAISCLFHMLCQRSLELEADILRRIDNDATCIAWNLVKEKKWQAGVIGYLVVVSTLLPSQNYSARNAADLVAEYGRQYPGSGDEAIEYLSHLLSLSELLGLWQKGTVSPDYITYLLTFKLQSYSSVRRELQERLELFDTLCGLFETPCTIEISHRSEHENKKDICACCFHIVRLISLYSSVFPVSYAYKFFHLSSRNCEISTQAPSDCTQCTSRNSSSDVPAMFRSSSRCCWCS